MKRIISPIRNFNGRSCFNLIKLIKYKIKLPTFYEAFK